ncbi:MAG: hypothetical protein DWQ41_18680 [Planctomycetota bacterium]|nr:MAG: hypothetical protein DWQ41_18680 [Planctomycetota bacterium]
MSEIAPSTGSRRHHAAAFGVLTVVTLCVFHRLTMHPDEILVGPQKQGHNDLIDYFIPSRAYAAASVTEFGQPPFWNPYICLGLPFTGNPQAALYYPPNWITFAIDPQHSLSWLLVAHHLFAGLGVYFLARRYGASWSAAVTGGAVFLAAPFLIAQSAEGHYPQICAVAWVPWAFLVYEVMRNGTASQTLRHNAAGSMPPASSNSLAGVLPLTACLAMSFFAGHAQETYYLVLILSAFVLWDVAARLLHRQGAAARHLLLNYGRTGLFTAGLVAIDLLPIYLTTKLTLRPSLQKMEEDFGRSVMTIESLRELIDPFAVTRPEDWTEGTVPFWEKVCHFGVLPLLLAASALFLLRRNGPARRMAVLWTLTLLFAFGSLTPVYEGLASVVPGMTWFRLPSRVLFFTSFATAVLAALAVSELNKRLSRRSVALACAVGAVLLLTCTAELTRFAHHVTDTARLQSLEQRDPQLLSLLQQTQDDGRSQRVLTIQEILSDLDAANAGIAKLRGYEPAGPARYLLLTAMLHESEENTFEPMGFLPGDVTELNDTLLDLTSVRYALQLRDPGEPPAEIEGWRRVRSARVFSNVVSRRAAGNRFYYTYDLLENESALPRAFIVGKVRELDGLREFQIALPNFDPRKEVALKQDVLPEGPRAAFRPAHITGDSPNRLEISAHLDAPGYLVVSDLWYPGWTAQLGDTELPVLEANFGFRTIPLPAGSHRVELAYVPRGLFPGAMISVLTLLSITLIVKKETRKHREVGDSHGSVVDEPPPANRLPPVRETVFPVIANR